MTLPISSYCVDDCRAFFILDTRRRRGVAPWGITAEFTHCLD